LQSSPSLRRPIRYPTTGKDTAPCEFDVEPHTPATPSRLLCFSIAARYLSLVRYFSALDFLFNYIYTILAFYTISPPFARRLHFFSGCISATESNPSGCVVSTLPHSLRLSARQALVYEADLGHISIVPDLIRETSCGHLFLHIRISSRRYRATLCDGDPDTVIAPRSKCRWSERQFC